MQRLGQEIKVAHYYSCCLSDSYCHSLAFQLFLLKPMNKPCISIKKKIVSFILITAVWLMALSLAYIVLLKFIFFLYN